MVVYQSIPILIRNPLPVGFGGDALSIANVQLPYMTISLIFSFASGFVISKFGNLRPIILGTIVTTIGFFILFLFQFNRGLNSCDSCVSSYWVSINADWFGKCRADFNFKAIQWDIIGNECSDLPYRILSGTCDCWNIHASKPGICKIW